ncbi:DUF3726 domain-containing protein [Vibrio tetraodonis]|uniref:DUF3726 domain-containing protein n=1 Tax=Vibrio tetraodonis TaxID=2231647 RepID=UPI000E0CAE2C|nr:DUF3726 domain-containing protein [Vibrio tetraodonis]
MMVSYNELFSAVEKAFRGELRLCGEADIIAAMVVDLQMLGLDGIRQFNQASRCYGWGPDNAMQYRDVNDNQLSFDLDYGSLACHFPVVIDVAIGRLTRAESLFIRIARCNHPWFIHGELIQLAAKGKASRASWFDKDSARQIFYVLNSGQAAPEITYKNTTENYRSMGDIVDIEISGSDFELPKDEMEASCHIHSHQLLATKELACRDGIFVEDAEWQYLVSQSKRNLVATNERSEKGAGETSAKPEWTS